MTVAQQPTPTSWPAQESGWPWLQGLRGRVVQSMGSDLWLSCAGRYVLEAILQPLTELDSAGPDIVIVLEACRQLEATYDQVRGAVATAVLLPRQQLQHCSFCF